MFSFSPTLTEPEKWGWQKNEDGDWEPVWTTIPEASKVCKELIKCECKVEKCCKKHCKCLSLIYLARFFAIVEERFILFRRGYYNILYNIL